MTTVLPPVLHEKVEGEVRELATVKPHVPTAEATLNLSAEQIALLMLSTHVTENCNKFFTEFTAKGRTTLEPEDRKKFTVGMLDAARKDVIPFFKEHLYYTQPVEDIARRDVTEATALQIVILILGNMVMSALQLKHERDQAGGKPRGKTH